MSRSLVQLVQRALSLSLSIRYNNFVEKPNLTEKSCLLVASRKHGDDEDRKKGPDVKLCKRLFARRWKVTSAVFLATLFSDIPRINFNGKPDEIDTIKQTFADFLRKVVAETSRDKDQDDRFS